MHSLLIAAILGVVEGLTEFLPVSSTGHMIIVGHLLGFEGDTAKTFEVVIQLGSILAVVVMFWRRLFGLIGIHFGRPLQHEGESKGRLTLIHILLGMIPAVVLGLLFHDTIKSLFNPINVMYALVVGGLLLIAAECLKPKEPRAPGLGEISTLNWSLVMHEKSPALPVCYCAGDCSALRVRRATWLVLIKRLRSTGFP